MRKIRIILFTILFVGMNNRIWAQASADEAYRAAVKELVKTNWETKSCNDFVVLGATDFESYSKLANAYHIALMVLPDATKNHLWNTYHEEQFIDDQTDIFMKMCIKEFTVEEVKKLTRDLPTIKNMNSFTDSKQQISQTFKKYLDPYLKGEFQGFENSDCSSTYMHLCNQFYTLLGMKKMFDEDLKICLGQPLYARHANDVKRYYADNETKFFLRICRENLSEEDLKTCVEYMSKQPYLYGKVVEISNKNHKKIEKMSWERFLEWMKSAEPDTYSAMNDWIKDMGW